MSDKKRNWIVRMVCKVEKEVYVENCSEEQARTEPFEFATDEVEVDMRDWEVRSVTPTE